MKIRKIHMAILFLFSYTSILISQKADEAMISFSLSDYRSSPIFKLEKMPVYYQFDDELITIVSNEIQKMLKDANIPYTIIDSTPWSLGYYLLSHRGKKNIALDESWGKLVWKKQNMALIKTDQLPIEQLIQNNLQPALFPNIPKYIRSENNILNFNTVHLNQDEISQVLAEIDPDSVRFFIQGLQDFDTRYYRATTRDAVAEWIHDQFIRIGITDVVIDSFFFSNSWQKNVVATLPGKSMPDKAVVLGGHHDSFTYDNPMVFAPGADDNASGTAAVMEIARAIMASQYQSEYTLKFVTFAAEEAGLHGSFDFAQKAVDAGLDIQLMLNHDMISYTTGSPGNWEIDLEYYSGYEYLVPLASQLILSYTTLIPVQGFLNSSGSDSYAFWANGFPAIYYFEHEFSPFYHLASDTLGNYNMVYCAEVVKASAALTVYTMETPALVENFQLIDQGDGNSLFLTWSTNKEPDLDGYRIYLGQSSGIYDSTFTTIGTSYIVDNLTEGIEYYVGLSAFDIDKNESMLVERSGIPLSNPKAPTDITDEPDPEKITLIWSANAENDLRGYHIYRSENPNNLGEQINVQISKDTVYQDFTAETGKYFYYKIKAVDSLFNESTASATVRSRIISMDGGILIVDETADGDGSLLNPTDAEVDNFYSQLLSGFTTEQYDILSQGSIKLADLGGYSSVIWHGNDFSDLSTPHTAQESIRKYLDYGGNLFISTYLPSRAFANNSYFQASFTAGDFLYDFLKIAAVELKPAARFNGAMPQNQNYDTLYVDSGKSNPALEYHLIQIESIKAAPGAQEMFNFTSNYLPTSPLGSMVDKPVGIEYLGNDYKLVLLSFPLYYIRADQAHDFLKLVFNEKFEEVVTIESEIIALPDQFELLQNFPNPFNPLTRIEFAISEPAHARIEVFNILGQRISLLMDEAKPAGYYTIEFDAGNLPGGVYFYRLQAESLNGESGNYQKTNKMLLLK